MDPSINQKLVTVLNDSVEDFPQDASQYSAILDKIGESRFVLIGEATHGTQEFYQTRAKITEQLITQKGFMAVAIEGDWPDAYRINRYIKGMGSQDEWMQALAEFKRFPTWMWRNKTVASFIQWLRAYNDKLSATNKIGFYGLDLYSLHSSMQAVIQYLAKADPEAAARARKRYACFDHFGIDPQTYGYLTSSGKKQSCLQEALEQVLELQHDAFKYIKNQGVAGEEEFFYATQNARLVKDAEEYYRSMFEDHVSSWNVRDLHMLKTLNILAEHLETQWRKPAKIIVWAHNSHVGDARANEMGERGEINIGQLTREHHGSDATYLLGFSTYEGFVTAADDWGAPAQHKRVNPGMVGSYEELFHKLRYKNFLLDLHDHDQIEHYFQLPRLQRAIGVVYRPDTELQSHYFLTRLPLQFDAIIHFDKTTAVQPLDKNSEWR